MEDLMVNPVRPAVHIIGGGTTFPIRPHLDLSTRAYGGTARKLAAFSKERWNDEADVELHLTRMASAGQSRMETNEDVYGLLKKLVSNPTTKVVFMSVALCDFMGNIMDGSMPTASGPHELRLKSRLGIQWVMLTPSVKLIGEIRRYRKDIFLIGFKTTTSESIDDQYSAGLDLVEKASCNLVLTSDLHTRMNVVVTPEKTRHHVTENRDEALRGLVDMAYLRSRADEPESQVGITDP